MARHGGAIAGVGDLLNISEGRSGCASHTRPMTPAEFKNFVRAEIDESAKVIKAAGIKAQ